MRFLTLIFTVVLFTACSSLPRLVQPEDIVISPDHELTGVINKDVDKNGTRESVYVMYTGQFPQIILMYQLEGESSYPYVGRMERNPAETQWTFIDKAGETSLVDVVIEKEEQ